MRVKLFGLLILACVVPAALQGCVMVAAVGAGMVLAAGGVTLADQLAKDHTPDREPAPPAPAARTGAGG